VALALLGACAVVGAGIALSSRAVTRRAIRPLLELTARVEAVEPGTGERSGFRSDLSELDALGRRFDDLVERFDAALAREKRFSAEASHELRTPLTIARAELEELMASATHDPRALARAVSSIDRLSSLVDALLWFARAQGRLDTEHLEVVNLADIVRDELDVVGRVLALQVTDRCIPDEALVRGDEELLRRAVANLLENAAKHGDGAPAAVRLIQFGDRLKLSIANGGRPIPAQFRDGIFMPFFRYRGDEHTVDGFGLGLPFARAVARAHGGELEHEPSSEHEVVMLLTLPLVDWNDG
jgi:signal transduction histidine kinase